MKYEVIARRYRPRKFEEVVGQEAIAQTLRGGIVQERLAHAYLFCGPRGTGKTSMARIFAKALNCAEAARRDVDRELWARPCDECSVCQAIHSGQDIDVIEMDGASHRGIEDVRQIIEGINRPGSRGLYKVYLIDEVHMLTREAFNALLKTLEEPPSHVKFIFATTEAHKIPDTVLSRCQRFDFQSIGNADIARRLGQITEAEGRVADPEIFEKIARYSRGGLRDSQTLLDQLMTFSDGESLSIEDLDQITGRVSDDALSELVQSVLAREPGPALAAVKTCLSRGADPSILLEQIIETFHARLVEAVAEAKSEEQLAALDWSTGALQVLLESARRLRHSAYPDISVELAIVKLARLQDPRSLERAMERLVQIEQSPAGSLAGGAGSRGPGGGGAPTGMRGPSQPSGGSAPLRSSGEQGSQQISEQASQQISEQASQQISEQASQQISEQASQQISEQGQQQAAPDSGFSSPAPVESPPQATQPSASMNSISESSHSPAAQNSPTATSLSHEQPGGGATATAVAQVPSQDSPMPEAVACNPTRLGSLWNQVLIEMQERYPDVAPFVEGRAPHIQQSRILFHIAEELPWKLMRSGRRLELCQETIRAVTGEAWTVEVVRGAEPGDGSALSVAASNAMTTPAAGSSMPAMPVVPSAPVSAVPNAVAPTPSAAGTGVGSALAGGSAPVGGPPPAVGSPSSAEVAANPPRPTAATPTNQAPVGSPPPSRPSRNLGPPVTLEGPIVDKAKKLFNARPA